MGEIKTRNFYEFGISEPVTKPKNHYHLSFETPIHMGKIENPPGRFKTMSFMHIGLSETHGLSISEKTRADDEDPRKKLLNITDMNQYLSCKLFYFQVRDPPAPLVG